MMQLSALVQLFFALIFVKGEETKTSYSPEEISSASSRALASDVTILYDFLTDFDQNYSAYESVMAEKSMTFPQDLQNYVIKIISVTEDDLITSALLTRDFPFNDFVTLAQQLPRFSSVVLKDAGATKLYSPNDFLVVKTAIVESSTSVSGTTGSSSLPSSTISSSFEITSSSASMILTNSSSTNSSSANSSSANSSSASSSSASSSSISSSSKDASSQSSTSISEFSSANGMNSLYIPVISFPLFIASLFL